MDNNFLPRLRLLPKISSVRPIVDLKQHERVYFQSNFNHKNSSIISNSDLSPIHIILRDQITKKFFIIIFIFIFSLMFIYHIVLL